MNRKYTVTVFLCGLFCLHTVALVLANNEERTQSQKDAESKYAQALDGYQDAQIARGNVKIDVRALEITRGLLQKEISDEKLAAYGTVLNTAVALLTGASAATIATRTAAAIVIGKSVSDMVRTIRDALKENKKATLHKLKQGMYNLETELIERTKVVQDEAADANSELDAWKAVEPGATYDKKPLDERYIDVETMHPDYTRTLPDPPTYRSDTTETIACPACRDQVKPPYLTKIVVLSPGLIMGIEKTVKRYRGHEVTCAETRHSTGKACDGEYYSCLSPYSSASIVCPNDADHRVVGTCGELKGSRFKKHEYAKGSPGNHGKKLKTCGSIGMRWEQSDGTVTRQVCKIKVFPCAPAHGRHNWDLVSFKKLSLNLGSGSNYICANSSCSMSGSSSSGDDEDDEDDTADNTQGGSEYGMGMDVRSINGSGSPNVPHREQVARALASRAWRALHWNHSVSLGISAAPEQTTSPLKLSYEHQRVCSEGHKYWLCDASQRLGHAQLVCSRSACGQAFTQCSNHSSACVGGWHTGGAGDFSETADALAVVCGNPHRRDGACAYGGQTPSVNAHRTTCLAGHTYWSCNAQAVLTHSKHTARLVTCGNSNAGEGACSQGRQAVSLNAHQTTCLAGHTYWSCNPVAKQTHSSHTASSGEGTDAPNTVPARAPAPTPARPPTGDGACGNSNAGAGACSVGGKAPSANAHRTTCLAGHTYWSCNAQAVITHSRHTAPLVACGNSNAGAGACSQGGRVVSLNAHQVRCLAGHTYWSCNPVAKQTHSSHTASSGESASLSKISSMLLLTGDGACGNSNAGDGACSAGGRAPSANAHQIRCLAGHTYWSCNAQAVVIHSRHTAPLVACGNSNAGAGACSAGGQAVSLNAHQARCLAGHTYWSCNPLAKQTHSSHTASSGEGTDAPHLAPVAPDPKPSRAPAPTPARPPTGDVACGNSNAGAGACSAGGRAPSANAHQVRCLAGHTYWSCNAQAVVRHSRHTAPLVACGNSNAGDGACSQGGRAVSANAHQTTCLAGHTYWSCNAPSVLMHSKHTAPVVCPADSWTDCGGTVSHAATCPAGHSYYTCNSSSASTHSAHTAPPPPPPPPEDPVVCPADSWTDCGGTVSHAATCPAGHSYYTCNSSSASTHSAHTAPPPPPPPPEDPVVCPADSWTDCGGTVSHAATCAAGHSYYTCNSSSASTHSAHTAPPPPPPPPEDPVVCPADSWTDCGGKVSHAATCEAGHEYYTCNSSAASEHSEHTAPEPACPASSWTDCSGTGTEHKAKCGRGHTYYTCNSSALKKHSKH